MLGYRTREWLILTSMAAALSLIFIDQTAISIALPTIQREFELDFTNAQWIMNAYALCLASTLTIGGRFGDRLSPQRTYYIGMVGFALGSLVCGLTSHFWLMLIGRVVQGLSGAFMLPAASVIVINHFPPAKRGRAIGFYVGIASMLLALGPFIGGFVTQQYSWRWIFFINLPISLLGISIAKTVISTHLPCKQVQRHDYFGFLLLLTSLACFVTALIESNRYGFTSFLIIGLLSLSIVVFGFFIRHIRRVAYPIVTTRLFRNRIFTLCAWILLQDQAVVVSITFWMLILQYAYLKTPAFSGFLLMACTLPIIFMAPVAGYSRDRLGHKLTIRIGAILMSFSSWWIALIVYKDLPLWFLLPGFFFFGTGSPFVLSTALGSALSATHYGDRGVASGIASTAKQLGSAIGLAVWGAIIGNIYFSQLAKILHNDSQFAGLTIESLSGLLARSEPAMAVIAKMPVVAQQQLLMRAEAAQRYSFAICMGCVGLVAFVSFLMTWWLPCDTANKEHGI